MQIEEPDILRNNVNLLVNQWRNFYPVLRHAAHPELQRQLAFTTASSTKKRKLSPTQIPEQDTKHDHDIPLESVEDPRAQAADEPPLFETPNSDPALPLPPIPSYLQTPSFSGPDCNSSAASSPSAAYAGLSIESEKDAEVSVASQRGSSLAPTSTRRSLSPIGSFARKAIMGGAAEQSQRSSSPLKRRASDLEGADVAADKQDVEMTNVSTSDSSKSTQPSNSKPTDTSVNHTNTDKALTKIQQKSGNAEHDIPSIDEQITTVRTITEASRESALQDGAKAYLVSKLWLKRVMDRGTEARQNSKVQPEGEIGPVDNSDLVQQIIKDTDGNDFVQLKPGAIDNLEMFPKDAWDLIVEWYGIMPGSLPIIRLAHNTNPDRNGIPNVVYELNPPVFKVHRLWGENNPVHIPQILKATNPPTPIFVCSTSTKYVDFLEKIKEKVNIDKSKKVKIWRVPRLLPAANPTATVPNTATPPSSRPGSPNNVDSAPGRQPQDSWSTLLLDVTTFLQLPNGNGREFVDQRDVSADSNYNGSITLAVVGLGEDQSIVIDEQVDSVSFVSNFTSKGSLSNSAAMARSGVSQSAPTSGRNSPGPSGPMTRGRTQKSGRTLGTVGLSNLGNTCYMNSALQCVRAVEELTKYFLSGTAKNELNYDNPLGNHGNVAKAYQHLLEEMYKEPVPASTAPRQFKTTIGKYAPSFSGYGQQDSQEFLGFLLDGLQEDLSRVKKKPYIEKPDSTDEMINNPALIRRMAAKVWDITKLRDDSVIADLFTGMYKSTLVCPHCSKVSITFDPFNNLTLQLPIENSWQHQAFYFPLNDPPVTISIDMDKQGTIFNMKQFISKRVGVPPERLFAAEEFKSKFYKIFKDNQVASEEISSNDVLVVYEIEAKPTNWPPKRIKKAKSHLHFGNNNDSEDDEIPNWDDPVAQKMLVPVFHRRPNPERGNRFKKAWILTPAPHFIVVNSKEARDLESIKRKILEKVATFSTSPEFQEDEPTDASVSDSVASDIVLTTGSDADSSGDVKVVANSIDGEDELVDVAMKDTSGSSIKENGTANSTSSGSETMSLPLKAFNKRRPKFLDPRTHLNPRLQNMFSLGHFSANKEMIPSGWNCVDDDKTYSPLEDRVQKGKQSPCNDSEEFEVESQRATSESSNEDDPIRSDAQSNQTRMNEESSEEDELVRPPPTRALPVRSVGGVRVSFNKRRAHRNKKTYSKKGNQQEAKLPDADEDTEEVVKDVGPLIRLGEGIVVDWHPDAWEALFDGSPGDTMRGSDTTSSIPKLADPELEAKRAARQARRKNGITLEDCLNEFGKEEILSEMDTWYCPRCKEHRRASKKFELWRTPDILVMHLKRFSSSAMRRDKLDVMVDFPVEGLDLTSRVVESQEGKQEIYDLIAVDDHWGGLGGGHYTAFAKSYVDGEWYEYNDASVSKTKSPDSVVTQAAYLLFYRRRSNEPLGGPRFKEIIDAYDNRHDPQEEDAGDSGEDQGLGGNTFLSGSSSALTGVGAAHRRPNPGSAREGMTHVSPARLESLPAYKSHEENDEDAAPLLAEDAMMNDGIPMNSIEEDEGIDMNDDGMNYTSMDYNSVLSAGPTKFNTSNWTFGALEANTRGQVSGTGSDEMDDGASDRVNMNSSASEGSREDRLRDFEDSIPMDGDIPFEDQCPVPDASEEQQATIIGMHHDLAEQRLIGERGLGPFHVESGIDDDDETPAAEIHVDGESWKAE